MKRLVAICPKCEKFWEVGEYTGEFLCPHANRPIKVVKDTTTCDTIRDIERVACKIIEVGDKWRR